MNFPKSTAISIKGDYCKSYDMSPDEKFQSTSKVQFPKPAQRSESIPNPINRKILDPDKVGITIDNNNMYL